MNKNVDLSEIKLVDRIAELYQAIIDVKNIEDCSDLFDDLCTYKEIEQMAQRITSARLLIEGYTYEEVIKKTKISSATLSRVSKCVKFGKGYNKILKNNE